MTRSLAILSIAMLVSSIPVSAQTLNATVSPNPVLVGQSVTLSITDAQGLGSQLPSGCVVTSVTQGGPSGIGTEVLNGVFCTANIVPIPSCASGQALSQQWSGNTATGPAPAGRYWFNVTFWDVGFTTLRTESFPFTIVAAASAPTLSTLTPPIVGTNFTMQIASPADAGSSYICASSATTNVGIPLGTSRIGLDPDALFLLTFPNPLPGVFTNYQGTLDASGNSPAIGINLPNFTPLQCLSIATEAVIIPSGGGAPKLTNTLHSTIF